MESPLSSRVWTDKRAATVLVPHIGVEDALNIPRQSKATLPRNSPAPSVYSYSSICLQGGGRVKPVADV